MDFGFSPLRRYKYFEIFSLRMKVLITEVIRLRTEVTLGNYPFLLDVELEKSKGAQTIFYTPGLLFSATIQLGLDVNLFCI